MDCRIGLLCGTRDGSNPVASAVERFPQRRHFVDRVRWWQEKSMKASSAALLLGALLSACAPVAPAGHSITTSTQDFTVEAFPGISKERPVVEGFVYNKRPMWATRVLLRVDALDAAGSVTASDVRHLDRQIPVNERVYFDVPAPAPAPAYRVSVE
jgi:hypothetical protein